MNNNKQQRRSSRFSFSRTYMVARRILQQIRRDRRTLGMMLMMPTIIMLIFGFSLSGEVKNIPILVDNQDTGYTAHPAPNVEISITAGSKIAAALQNDSRVKYNTGSFDKNRASVDNGTYFAVIKIPANFSETIFQRQRGQNKTAEIQIYIDATKPAIRASIQGALQSALQSIQGGSAFKFNEELAFGGAQYTGLDVGIPSVIGFVLTFLVLLISLITITRETISGTLQRLYATPLTALERLVGYAVALLLLSMMLAGVILGIGILVFGAAVKGNLAVLIFAAVLYALTHVLIAVFLSNFAKNELQAVQMAPLIALPSLALSGMLVPVNSLPEFVQPIARLVPLYYGNRVFEGIMLKGYGLLELAPEFLVIGVIAFLSLILALATVKDRINA
ncbi:MAG: ABC transporter permease [Thaumarchaeota archaeon]|nr:ABC transporter permease [Nitrososphaerota archaeon]